MTPKKSKLHAWVASATAFTVAFTQVAFAAPAFSVSTPEVSLPDTLRLDQAVEISVPGQIATIDKLIPGSDKTIFHIQTAHGQYEAEKNIEALLTHLEKNYGVDTVLMEGASQPLNPEVLNFFPEDRKTTLEAVDALVRNAVVTGPEVFLLNSGKAQGLGIENEASYKQNLKDFADVIQAREASSQFLSSLEIGIERLSAIYLSSDLRSFLSRVEKKETGDVPFDSYLQELKTAAAKFMGIELSDASWQVLWPMLTRVFAVEKLEKSIDAAVFKKQKAAFLKAIKPHAGEALYAEVEKLLNLKDLSAKLPDPETSALFESLVRALPVDFNYDAYSSVTAFCGILMLRSQINVEVLASEIAGMEDKISGKLAETQNAKALVATLKNYRMLKKLFALELLPADFEALKKNSIKPSQITAELKKLNGSARAKEVEFKNTSELNSLYDKAIRFYEGARIRDQKMIERIEERLVETQAKKVAVVTGGFHSEPFGQYFGQKGYSYALMTPKMTTVDAAGRQNYLDIIQMWASAPSAKAAGIATVGNATLMQPLATANAALAPKLFQNVGLKVWAKNLFDRFMSGLAEWTARILAPIAPRFATALVLATAAVALDAKAQIADPSQVRGKVVPAVVAPGKVIFMGYSRVTAADFSKNDAFVDLDGNGVVDEGYQAVNPQTGKPYLPSQYTLNPNATLTFRTATNLQAAFTDEFSLSGGDANNGTYFFITPDSSQTKGFAGFKVSGSNLFVLSSQQPAAAPMARMAAQETQPVVIPHRTSITSSDQTSKVVFSVPNLPAGTYTVNLNGVSSQVNWKGGTFSSEATFVRGGKLPTFSIATNANRSELRSNVLGAVAGLALFIGAGIVGNMDYEDAKASHEATVEWAESYGISRQETEKLMEEWQLVPGDLRSFIFSEQFEKFQPVIDRGYDPTAVFNLNFDQLIKTKPDGNARSELRSLAKMGINADALDRALNQDASSGVGEEMWRIGRVREIVNLIESYSEDVANQRLGLGNESVIWARLMLLTEDMDGRFVLGHTRSYLTQAMNALIAPADKNVKEARDLLNDTETVERIKELETMNPEELGEQAEIVLTQLERGAQFHRNLSRPVLQGVNFRSDRFPRELGRQKLIDAYAVRQYVGRSESRLTPEQRQALDQAVQTFNLSPENEAYMIAMMLQTGKQPLKIRIGENGGNYVLAGALSPEQRTQFLGAVPYDSIKGNAAFLGAAKKAAAIIYSLDGGLGEKLVRSKFKATLVERGLLKEADVERDEAGVVKIGAKGPDTGFIVKLQGQEVFLSIAEAKLLQMIHFVDNGTFGTLGIQPLVNKDSLPSYQKLFERPYLFDRLEGRATVRTYRQVLEEKGIEIREPFLQQDVPGIDVEKNIPATTRQGTAQPGGHGQLGFGFFYNPEAWQPRADGLVDILVFTNGDNLNSSNLSPEIIGMMLTEKKPVVKLTTRATPIDKKGGKDGVEVVEQDGQVVAYIPQQLEIADAQANKQEPEFIAAGQDAGAALFGAGSVGNQPFNTNTIIVAKDLLFPMLAKLKKALGADRYYAEVIAPSLIPKDPKTGKDGRSYRPVDGAIGTVIHNLNEFIMRSLLKEKLGEELDETDRAVISIIREAGYEKILYFVDVPREFFTPQKNPFDAYMQYVIKDGGYYGLNTTTFTFNEQKQGLVPPLVDIKDSKGQAFDSGKGRYAELQNIIDTFGDEANIQGLRELHIAGDVVLLNATLAGKVSIKNESGNVVDLNTIAELPRTDGRLNLTDIEVVVDAAGAVTTRAVRSEQRVVFDEVIAVDELFERPRDVVAALAPNVIPGGAGGAAGSAFGGGAGPVNGDARSESRVASVELDVTQPGDYPFVQIFRDAGYRVFPVTFISPRGFDTQDKPNPIAFLDGVLPQPIVNRMFEDLEMSATNKRELSRAATIYLIERDNRVVGVFDQPFRQDVPQNVFFDAADVQVRDLLNRSVAAAKINIFNQPSVTSVLLPIAVMVGAEGKSIQLNTMIGVQPQFNLSGLKSNEVRVQPLSQLLPNNLDAKKDAEALALRNSTQVVTIDFSQNPQLRQQIADLLTEQSYISYKGARFPQHDFADNPRFADILNSGRVSFFINQSGEIIAITTDLADPKTGYTGYFYNYQLVDSTKAYAIDVVPVLNNLTFASSGLTLSLVGDINAPNSVQISRAPVRSESRSGQFVRHDVMEAEKGLTFEALVTQVWGANLENLPVALTEGAGMYQFRFIPESGSPAVVTVNPSTSAAQIERLIADRTRVMRGDVTFGLSRTSEGRLISRNLNAVQITKISASSPVTVTTTPRSEVRPLTKDQAIVILEKFTAGILPYNELVSELNDNIEAGVLVKALQAVGIKLQLDDAAAEDVDDILATLFPDAANTRDLNVNADAIAARVEKPTTAIDKGIAFRTGAEVLANIKDAPKAFVQDLLKLRDGEFLDIVAADDAGIAAIQAQVAALLNSADGVADRSLHAAIIAKVRARAAADLPRFIEQQRAAGVAVGLIMTGYEDSLFDSVSAMPNVHRFVLGTAQKPLKGKGFWTVPVVHIATKRVMANIAQTPAADISGEILKLFNELNLPVTPNSDGSFGFGAIATLAIVAAKYIEIMA